MELKGFLHLLRDIIMENLEIVFGTEDTKEISVPNFFFLHKDLGN